MEVLNRFEGYMLNDCAEAIRYVKLVNTPNVKVMLDNFHMNIEEDSIADAISFAQQKGRLGHLHVGESNRRIPGFDGKTHMDWDAILSAVKACGYSGYITMEPFMKMGMTTICCWRDLSHGADLEKMTEYAKAGAQFLRSKLI